MSVLPLFRYHPDPLATGSVEASDQECDVCHRGRAFVYNGPVYSAIADDPTICPWCIAGGSAADRLQAEFTDVGWGVPDGVPERVLHEVARRTPGFYGWQQEHWLYHCDEAAAYMGRVGYEDLVEAPDALAMLLHENDEFGWTPEQSRMYERSLDKTESPTGYWFRCVTCGADLAYSDTD